MRGLLQVLILGNLWNTVYALEVPVHQGVFLFTIQKPLPPPDGYNSWLDYAVECFDTREPWLESHWKSCIDENVVELDRQEIRDSARMELQALRKAPGSPDS
ncbi:MULTISPECIES: hypothetical protein [unclassified Variovorax]|uniref:hypothetical protein n=1 Tax=unclassified Variovorax TaxID=663243 RepID=UPI003F46CEE1